MKTMKYFFLFTVLSVAVLSGSCKKKDCDLKITQCSETPPTNEACQAAFNRWFFNEDANACELIGYSGCSQKGFATQEECEACKCK